tara:strand:- start:587 stop:1273 length:687 start_codon:yes stop_codon:yes gene_type:complete
MITLILQDLYNSERSHIILYAIIFTASLGPFIIAMENPMTKSSIIGIFCMIFALITGALKNIFAHSIIKNSRSLMGILSFTFWIEIICSTILLPWSLLSEELFSMLDLDSYMYPAIFVVALMGGVRILSQFYFLKFTSPTSLALSNICIQLMTTCSSFLIFNRKITFTFMIGILISLISSSIYAYVKSYSIFDKKYKYQIDVVEDEKKEMDEPIRPSSETCIDKDDDL